jgi:hypothetical protein
LDRVVDAEETVVWAERRDAPVAEEARLGVFFG